MWADLNKLVVEYSGCDEIEAGGYRVEMSGGRAVVYIDKPGSGVSGLEVRCIKGGEVVESIRIPVYTVANYATDEGVVWNVAYLPSVKGEMGCIKRTGYGIEFYNANEHLNIGGKEYVCKAAASGSEYFTFWWQ